MTSDYLHRASAGYPNPVFGLLDAIAPIARIHFGTGSPIF